MTIAAEAGRHPAATVPWLAVAIAVIFLALRWNGFGGIYNIDETIPVAVSQAMAERGDLDTNWRKVEALPDFLRIDSYGFSSYVLVSHALLSVTGYEAAFLWLRRLNVMMQAIGVVLVASALRRLGCPPAAVLLGAGLLAVASGLVHDAHMARPESLLFLMFAFVFRAAAAGPATAKTMLVAAIAIGFGAATKPTFLLVGLLMLPNLLALMRKSPRDAAVAGAVGIGSVLVGFLAGIPALIGDPGGLWTGNGALLAQYSGEHPPHSFQDGSPLRTGQHMLAFLTLAYGPLLVALPAALLAPRSAAKSGLALTTAAIIAVFSLPNVFFERNLVIAICCCLVLVAMLAAARPLAGGVLAATVAAPMLWWSANIALQSNFDWAGLNAFEGGYFGGPVPRGWVAEHGGTARCEGVAGVFDYGDDYSAALHLRLAAAGWTRSAMLPGLFRLLPTSTLHTYLSADVVYYRCPGGVGIGGGD